MKLIKDLFDENKNIYRAIEKVVTFGNVEPDSLKREISEYVVTPRIKDNFEKILDDLYSGMEAGSSEVGIWVSGFYGSGKSSFSKYLGLALNKELEIENIPFSERLANRINSTPVSQLIKSINQKHNPVIFLIDLATQQISGYDLAPVSTIIYNEVMKWAGYASEAKIALLERTLEMDNRLSEFKEAVQKEKQVDWDEIKFKDILKAKGIAQDMACRFYPSIWPDRRAFNVMKIDDIENERERMARMFDLIKKRKGKDKVLFIIDEVGQYIAAKEQLILQLQGTMENIKDIGQGKAWLLATAQQTLTEDNPNARFNSDKLFKLNDRFPVKVEVEASDIKEITTQRLLGKSNAGTDLLKKRYQQHGERLRLLTRLEKAQGTPYKADLDEKNFVDLYPFLPIHFDILLNLLGKLARKTGGVGLRSALRVIQDVLTEKAKGQLAEEKIGGLANTVNIYNILKSDIRKSYSHVIAAVDKVIEIYGENTFYTEVAKSIAVLQLLDDLFLSIENLAALMHPSIETASTLDQVKQIVNELKKSSSLTLKEIDGQLRFMTEAITNIEQEKNKIYVGGTDTRKVIEAQLEDIFQPVPNARIFNTKTVKTGVILNHEERLYKLAEPNETVQTEIRFVLRDQYQEVVEDLLKGSTERINTKKIYLVGLLDEDLGSTLEEIVRCQEIGSTRLRYKDKEILDYLNSQLQEAERMRNEVRRKLIQAMENGEFIFRGKNS
ncbi:MAG: BREX system P-loop protein BrxC, partial [Bacteroidota bacterium]